MAAVSEGPPRIYKGVIDIVTSSLAFCRMNDIYMMTYITEYSSNIQNETNFENEHLVSSILKEKQENNGVGDLWFLFHRHCPTNRLYYIG